MATEARRKPAKAKRPAAKKKAEASKSSAKTREASLETRLALDRFLLGIWIDRDLMGLLSSGSKVAAPLRPLARAREFDRPREGERLREALFGRERPSEVERFEALLRQGVDCVVQKMPVLAELQHDLLAHADAVAKDDPRALAMRAVVDYAAASQVNLAVQAVGRLAEATVDRVANARRQALSRLEKTLADFPHLSPRG